MSGDPAATARHQFIERLAKLRQDAGQPSLPALRRLSEKLAGPASARRILTESTTHDILSGKRRGLPTWIWVAAYVRACHAAAQHAELDPARLGSLDDWHRLWAAAWDAARGTDATPLSAPLPTPQTAPHAGLATVPHPVAEIAPRPLEIAPHPGSAAKPPAALETAPQATLQRAPRSVPLPAAHALVQPSVRPIAAAATAASSVTSSAMATLPPPPQRTRSDPGSESPECLAEFGPIGQRGETLKRYLRAFGVLGGRLLVLAEDGDSAAAYRLGVLLSCDGRPQEGLAWLERAARDGVSDASHLSDERVPTLAAEAAYQLGQASDRAGDSDAALVYYKVAANCGHAKAAYHAGTNLTSAGEPFAAGYWFGKAVHLGHPDADQHLNDIYDQVRDDLNTPP